MTTDKEPAKVVIPDWVCNVIEQISRRTGLSFDQTAKLLILQGATDFKERMDKHHADQEC